MYAYLLKFDRDNYLSYNIIYIFVIINLPVYIYIYIYIMYIDKSMNYQNILH